jgi:tryptophanase
MESKFKKIIEPFKIKMVEPIKMTTYLQRKKILQDAHYNLFLIRSRDIMVDLLTDSGTGAMMAKQWGAVMEGDESYAGCDFYYQMRGVVEDLTQMKHIYPTHQGRAAERILFGVVGGEDRIIPNNADFY